MRTIHMGHEVCTENPIKVSILFSHPSSRTRSRGRAWAVDFWPVGGGPAAGRPRAPMAWRRDNSGAAGRLRGTGCYTVVQRTREEDGMAGVAQTVATELGRQHDATMADTSRAGERRRPANLGWLGWSPAAARGRRTPKA
jgi:hypothetical protein